MTSPRHQKPKKRGYRPKLIETVFMDFISERTLPFLSPSPKVKYCLRRGLVTICWLFVYCPIGHGDASISKFMNLSKQTSRINPIGKLARLSVL